MERRSMIPRLLKTLQPLVQLKIIHPAEARMAAAEWMYGSNARLELLSERIPDQYSALKTAVQKFCRQ